MLNRYAFTVCRGIGLFKDIGKSMRQASKDNEKYYGKSVPIFPKELEESLIESANKTQPDVLDIGAGIGMTVWRELLSGANVVAADIAYKDMSARLAFETYISNKVPQDVLQNRLTVLDDDIFSLNKISGLYREAFDIVNIQNVIHFYCPEDIKLMIDGIYNLLKPNGIAVVTANSLYLRKMYMDEKCAEIYKKATEANNAFPGYIKVYMQAAMEKHIYFDSTKNCHKIEDMQDDSLCSFKQELFAKDGNAYLTKVWNDFDIQSLSQLFAKDRFDIISASYYSLTLGPGSIEDPEQSFSVSISARKKETAEH
ncbi:class I SAM-dependent methyltransferase [Holosporaceae bacterium 'Namur']|nr:class I SAM-dependent methyltransferase [Holosporaceae bacterium 'Namur']